jgi:hypothetical protein
MSEKKFRDKSDLLNLRHFETKAYGHYALTSLTVFCLYWLQEWGISSTLENLSIASHKMFPFKFAMVGWPQFPDINRTNRSVLQMRPKYRNWATSASSKGIFLNQNGIQEAKALIEKLGSPVFEGEKEVATNPALIRSERGTGKPRSVHAEDKIDQLRKSYIFDLYLHSRFDEVEAIDSPSSNRLNSIVLLYSLPYMAKLSVLYLFIALADSIALRAFIATIVL